MEYCTVITTFYSKLSRYITARLCTGSGFHLTGLALKLTVISLPVSLRGQVTFLKPFFLVCRRSQRRIFLNTGACPGRINAWTTHTKRQFLQSVDRTTRNSRTLIHLSASHLHDMGSSNQSAEICSQSLNYKSRAIQVKIQNKNEGIETNGLKPNDPEFNA